MNNKMIVSAEKTYRKFENKAAIIAKDVESRLDDLHCEVHCDVYKGDGLCVCFENLKDSLKDTRLNILDSFVVPVKSIPKRGKIDINFIFKNSI